MEKTIRLDQYIRELLYQYDCVIVPGLGGFVCSFNPARIHPVQHRFYPPSKRISFNQMLSMNDGLLAHFVAVSTKKTYADSLTLIESEVKNWKESLQQSGRISLEGIGMLFRDAIGNLQFQPDEKVNYLRESFGLTEFQALPIERAKVVRLPIEEKVSEESGLRVSHVLVKSLKYSAAAAVLSIAVLATIKLNLLPDVSVNHISLNPFKAEARSYKPMRHDVQDVAKFDFNSENTDLKGKVYLVEDGPIAGKAFEILSDEVELTSPEIIVEKAFHVVGGCFSVEDNARKLKKRLEKKGYAASMPGMYNGLHVVAYQSFVTDDDARAFLEEVKRDDNAQAWILRK